MSDRPRPDRTTNLALFVSSGEGPGQLAQAIEAGGHRVVSRTAGEAVAHVRALRPDLIVIDYDSLYAQRGQLLRVLDLSHAAPGVPLIVLVADSGFAATIQRVHVHLIRPAAVLKKPVKQDELLAELNRITSHAPE